MARVRCVVMQRDEAHLLAPWLRYHSYLFGLENLTVLDNGSTDTGVLATLDRAEAAGVQVLRQFKTQGDFANKGDHVANVIRWWDHVGGYDFAFPLDCDEFVAVWKEGGPSCRRSDIHAALDNLIGETAILAIQTCIYNVAGRPGWFWPQGASKGFFAAGTLATLDHGFHHPTSQFAASPRKVPFTYIHMHYKPLATARAHALWKLAPFVNINDADAVRTHKGPGVHLARLFNMDEAEYLRHFDDYLLFAFSGFFSTMELLGFPGAIFEETEHSLVSEEMMIRLPRTAEKPCQLAGRFNPQQYLELNLDVAAAGVVPVVHYLLGGYAEGRKFNRSKRVGSDEV